MPKINLPSPSDLINCIDIASCFQNLYNFLFILFLALAFFYFLIGAFKYLFSATGIFSQQEGKKYMIDSLLALIVLLILPVILNFINPNIFKAKLMIPQIEASLPQFDFFIAVGTMFYDSNKKSYYVAKSGYHLTEKKFCEYLINNYDTSSNDKKDLLALLMAIVNKESNFGRFIGVFTINDGYGKTIKRGNIKFKFIMKDRQKETFRNFISNDLKNAGVNPNSVLFSSDGGMGPFQFMPTTWYPRYRNLISSKFSGKPNKHPNPWDWEHAVYAAYYKLSNTPGTLQKRAKDYNGFGERAIDYSVDAMRLMKHYKPLIYNNCQKSSK